MSILPNVYYKKNCFKFQTIQLINQFLNNKYEHINVDNLSQDDQAKVLKKSPIGFFPLYQVGDYFLSGTKSIILFLLQTNTNKDLVDTLLKKDNNYDQSLVEMWTDFVISNIWVLLEIMFSTDKDKIMINDKDDIYQEAKKDLLSVLQKVNDHLVFQTYMVGTSMSLADLFLAAALKPVFDLVLLSDEIKKLNNLTRWYKLNSNNKQFISVFGEAKLN